MRTFVILAAGRGTRIGRVGESLHKCLVPLAGKAVLSHLLDLAPVDAKIVICLGHRGPQVREYLSMAHPQRQVSFVNVPDYDKPGSGPGTSLQCALPQVEGDLCFTSCDTLWERDSTIFFEPKHSWAAVAPVPAGTQPSRWCRFDVEDGRVAEVLDKRVGGRGTSPAYVGLAYVLAEDMETFWLGLETAGTKAGEVQVSSGFDELLTKGRVLEARHVNWTDVGDEAAYRRAVAKYTGYDWTKLNEATYVLPEEGRVVKFWANGRDTVKKRWHRAVRLGKAVPGPGERLNTMLAYPYVPGVSGYAAATVEGPVFTERLLAWRRKYLMQPAYVDMDEFEEACMSFYRDKTLARLALLPEHLRLIALDAVGRVDWMQLMPAHMPGFPHGDLNFGNVVVTAEGRIVGLDWREDFAGHDWGDVRYDLAKLIAGTVVHWDRARRGDFRPWDEGPRHADVMRRDTSYTPEIEIIGALSLLSSAPLHASPLDEILVDRGCDWLERVV